jgi:hypothetical protein
MQASSCVTPLDTMALFIYHTEPPKQVAHTSLSRFGSVSLPTTPAGMLMSTCHSAGMMCGRTQNVTHIVCMHAHMHALTCVTPYLLAQDQEVPQQRQKSDSFDSVDRDSLDQSLLTQSFPGPGGSSGGLHRQESAPAGTLRQASSPGLTRQSSGPSRARSTKAEATAAGLKRSPSSPGLLRPPTVLEAQASSSTTTGSPPAPNVRRTSTARHLAQAALGRLTVKPQHRRTRR